MLTLLHLFLLLHFSLFNCLLSNALTVRITGGEVEEYLIYVQAVWRHGDRAPHQLPYPSDLNDERSWPRGWSQLTNIGMKQMYELGVFFRKRYNGYIEEFNPTDIRIVTSRSDRAIVSAQAMLRGLFPANNASMQWMNGEQWQPIAFHSENSERNAPFLHPTLHSCPRYDQLVRNETAMIVDTMMQKYADVVQLLANVTGIGEGLSFGRIAALFDIQREIEHRLPQPEWVYQKWPKFQGMRTIDIITEFKRISQISKHDTFEKAKLKGGLLLGDLLHRFQNVSAGIKVEARKMFLYSAHDSTLLPLLHALNASNSLMVPYSACIIMELYQTKKDGTVVKILYRNETGNADAHELLVPGCSVPCTLDQLIRLSAPTMLNTVDDLNMACEENDISKSAYDASNASRTIIGNGASQHNITMIISAITMMISASTFLMLLCLLLRRF